MLRNCESFSDYSLARESNRKLRMTKFWIYLEVKERLDDRLMLLFMEGNQGSHL